VVEFIAALRSLRIQLTAVAVRIAIKINVMVKPNLPFKGEKATISKVEETVNIAPSKSGKTCLGVSFHGRFGLATSRV
jgi:hypothetical protein